MIHVMYFSKMYCTSVQVTVEDDSCTGRFEHSAYYR